MLLQRTTTQKLWSWIELQMSLKGRGQGVDLGTSTLSLTRSIFFSFFGLALPYDPLNLFPFFVLLSPRPHSTGALIIPTADLAGGRLRAGRCAPIARLATAAHHCIIAIAATLSPSRQEESKRRMWLNLGLSPWSFTTDRIGPIKAHLNYQHECRRGDEVGFVGMK